MTSKSRTPKEAYVWIWLPGATEPVVAGKLTAEGRIFLFNYGKSYLARKKAISLFDEELPLKEGIHSPRPDLIMPGCIRDASPDAWGRRVLLNRLGGARGKDADTIDIDELTYLLESGSDRIGALDFQLSAKDYVPREGHEATLEELLNAAEKVEKGIPLSAGLDQAILHGSSIGGARPKAIICADMTKYIAKFGSSTDLYSVVKAEFVAMRLAAVCGLDVAFVRLVSAARKDVLLIERFDREHTAKGWKRRAMLSALTLFGLDEMQARYASYEDLAELIRRRFANPKEALRELFSRMVFNILCGNTDDHARNHAAFWNGSALALTPAYDICPQPRTGNEASQAMLISGANRMSRISACLESVRHYLLPKNEATSIVTQQIQSIGEHWPKVCEEASLSPTDLSLLWGRQFLNPYAFDDLNGDVGEIKKMADDVRQRLK